MSASNDRHHDKMSQADKFEQAAKEHGCDPDEKSWEERLKKVAKTPPEKPDNS